MQIKCNIFKTLFRNAGIVLLGFICERIRSGYYANAIKVLREAIAQGDNLLADRLKKALDAFTVSALYNGARKLEHMVKYIGLVVLDFDNLDPAAIPDLKRRAAEMKETIVAFISPSGRGMKIICRPYVSWALTLANHVRTFLAMAALYLETLGIAADGSGKDPGRLCFVSDDADIFFDPSRLEGFEGGSMGVEEGIGVQGTGYGEEETPPKNPPTAEAENPVPHTPYPEPLEETAPLFAQLMREVEKGCPYKPKNRNNHIFQLACRCRDKGMSADDTLGHLRKVYPERPAGETETSVRSAYSPQPEQPKPRTSKMPKSLAMKAALKEKYEGRYNVLAQVNEIREKGTGKWEEVNDNVEASLWCYLNEKGISCTRDELHTVLVSDFTRRYDPVKERILEAHKKYGGTGYTREFLNLVEAEEQEYWLKCGAIWLRAMVNGWLHPGQANHQLLVFISDKQGVGKTTFARLLLPPEWRLRYFNETLADYGNKDSKIAACTNLVINLDEIKKARSDREQDQLKALITMSYCHERLPYRKNPQMLLRRASFFGTTNDPNIIHNMEGSRRHFIIPVKSINYRAEIDCDKLYADLYDGLLTGEKHFLAGDEIEEVMEKNEQFREVSAEEELFLTNVKQPDDFHPGVWYTPTEILNQLNLRTSLNLFAYNVQKIGYLLAKYGYQRKRLHGGGWIYYVYIVPVEQAGM